MLIEQSVTYRHRRVSYDLLMSRYSFDWDPRKDAANRKKQVTIRLDEDTVAYFKNLAEKKDLPYQSIINLYLRDCAQSHKDLKIEWQ